MVAISLIVGCAGIGSVSELFAPVPRRVSLVRGVCIKDNIPGSDEISRLAKELDQLNSVYEAKLLLRRIEALEQTGHTCQLKTKDMVFGQKKTEFIVARFGDQFTPESRRVRGIHRIQISGGMTLHEEGYFFVRRGADAAASEFAAITNIQDLARLVPFVELFPITLDREDRNGTRCYRPSLQDCESWMIGIKMVAEAKGWQKQREMLVRLAESQNEALASWAVFALRNFAPDQATIDTLRDRLKNKKVSALVVAATDMTLTRWQGKKWTESQERVDRLVVAVLSDRLTATQAHYLVGYLLGKVELPTVVAVARKALAGEPGDEGPELLRKQLDNLPWKAKNFDKANLPGVEQLMLDLSAEPYPKPVREAAARALIEIRSR